MSWRSKAACTDENAELFSVLPRRDIEACRTPLRSSVEPEANGWHIVIARYGRT